MATVSETLTVASKLSGLRADTAENDIALMAINRAYLRSCLDCELTGSDVSYAVPTTTGTLSASAVAGTAVMRVQHLRVAQGINATPVQQVSRQELQDYLATDSVGTAALPNMYSVSMVGANVTLDFWPAISAGTTIKMSYLASPAPLTTATTSISYMPEMFQHDILTHAAVAILLERDGRFQDAQVWNSRSLEAMTRLEEYLGQMGGTANRAYVAPVASRPYYPDSR